MFINSQGEKNLDILGTFHNIMGVLTAAMACIPLVHFFIGIAILGPGPGEIDAVPRVIGLLFVILSGIIIAAGWVMAVLIFVAGNRLKQRRAYNYCLVIAFLECLIMPLGTVLGIFTILNLTKEPIRELFD